MISRERAWTVSTLIVAIFVAGALFLGTQTGRFGFDGDDAIVGAVLAGGWF